VNREEVTETASDLLGREGGGYIKQVFQSQITSKIQAQGGSNTGHHLLLLTCASPSNLQLHITASSSVFSLAEEKNKNKEQ
jgi:adenylosuccinate synthase